MPTFPEPFYPSFYCLPQQFWHFYFPLLSLSFQESCRQLVSTVSQGPFLYRGRVKSCITGECSCFDQFFLIQLSVLSALDSAPSGSGLINAIWLCRYVMARSCRVPFSPQQTQYLTGQVSTIWLYWSGGQVGQQSFILMPARGILQQRPLHCPQAREGALLFQQKCAFSTSQKVEGEGWLQVSWVHWHQCHCVKVPLYSNQSPDFGLEDLLRLRM